MMTYLTLYTLSMVTDDLVIPASNKAKCFSKREVNLMIATSSTLLYSHKIDHNDNSSLHHLSMEMLARVSDISSAIQSVI